MSMLTTILIRYLWQLKTVVFLHWRLIRAVLLLVGDATQIVSHWPRWQRQIHFCLFCVAVVGVFDGKIAHVNAALRRNPDVAVTINKLILLIRNCDLRFFDCREKQS
jgi:hypothetical protein